MRANYNYMITLPLSACSRGNYVHTVYRMRHNLSTSSSEYEQVKHLLGEMEQYNIMYLQYVVPLSPQRVLQHNTHLVQLNVDYQGKIFQRTLLLDEVVTSDSHKAYDTHAVDMRKTQKKPTTHLHMFCTRTCFSYLVNPNSVIHTNSNMKWS